MFSNKADEIRKPFACKTFVNSNSSEKNRILKVTPTGEKKKARNKDQVGSVRRVVGPEKDGGCLFFAENKAMYF